MQLAGSFSNKQRWPFVSGVQKFWANGTSAATPTIAVVDSGIDASRPDFGGRVVAQVNLTSLAGNSAGDGRGHGTFVAGIAAGSGDGYAGAAPASKLVSIDVMDDQGMAMTRDVIAAADWILQNKDKYGIRVANFSLHSSQANSFMFDPLDKAVERLWFAGVVVVAAAGNYGVDGQPSGVPFAPGNDPFVITVGADDIDGSVSTNDDYTAPWSAYGYTLDGFAQARHRGARPLHGRPCAGAPRPSSRRSRRASSPPATSSSPAPRSRLRSSPARPPRSCRRIPRGRPTRSRAR